MASAIVVALAMTACNRGGAPATPPAATTSAATTSAATTTATAPSTTTGGIPPYQPSTVTSQATGSTVLLTPDPVGKVRDFYQHVIEQGGWQVVSQTAAGPTASFVVKKSGQGASIAVAPTPNGAQTVISISTYPAP